MKAAEAKTSATTARQNTPFFHQEGSQHFFGKKAEADPFFSKPATPSLQTKLTIGQPGDPYEQEADAMADQVVQRLSEPGSKQAALVGLSNAVTPLIQTKCATCEQEEKLQRKEEEELPEEALQRKPIFESNAPPPEEEIQRKCADCEAEEKLQRKGEGLLPVTQSLSSLEIRLASARGSGSPLPDDTRAQMESTFGADFSKVRIHTDSTAVQMNQDLHAQAFTHGHDIYFDNGKYNTTNNEGRHLLAHELTHTVQQGATVNQFIQRTSHGHGGASFTPTNCANPLIPLSARMAGVAAHAQIAGMLSTLGIHPQSIPRATKRLMGTTAPPFGTPLGFADLWTIAGGMVRISEIKSTNIGHGRARTEARHYADRHNQWNTRWPNVFPDDALYNGLIHLEGGTHPILGDVLDLSVFTGTGLALGPFVADPGKLLFVEGDAHGAMVYWCQGPGIINPVLVLLLKKALDKLKNFLQKAKRILQDIIDNLPTPGEVGEAIAMALAILLIVAALVCLIIAILCVAGIVTAPCAALGLAGAATATAAALLLLGINIPGITEGGDTVAAIGSSDFRQPSALPATEREMQENTIWAMASSILMLPEPIALAQSRYSSIPIEQSKSVLRNIISTLETADQTDEATYIRSQLSRLETA